MKLTLEELEKIGALEELRFINQQSVIYKYQHLEKYLKSRIRKPLELH